MNCRHVEQMLSDHLEGLLPKRHAGRISDHLRVCPACRGLLEEIRAAGAALGAPLDRRARPGLERRIVEQWLEERTTTASRPGQRPAINLLSPARAFLMAAVSLAILTVALGLAGRHSRPLTQPSWSHLAQLPRRALSQNGGRMRRNDAFGQPGLAVRARHSGARQAFPRSAAVMGRTPPSLSMRPAACGSAQSAMADSAGRGSDLGKSRTESGARQPAPTPCPPCALT